VKNSVRRAVFSAFLKLMRPAVRMLLRCGVTWKEASELIKIALVDVASEDLGKHGRPANTSRIALITGMSRREVKRLRDRAANAELLGDAKALGTVNHASRVLSGWHQHRDFLTASGKPRLLSLRGPRSFETLAKRFAPDIPSTVVLKELKSAGAVRETDGGKLRAVERYYMPVLLAPAAIARSGEVLGDFGDTVVHNLFAQQKPTRFEARATNRHIPRRLERAFQRFLEQHAIGFLAEADAWLTAHEAEDPPELAGRLGVGVYMIRHDADD